MSGIAGILERAPQALPLGALEAMSAALMHRGPDEALQFERPGVGLACRRLATLALPSGQQPVTNENQTVFAVFHGALTNAPELRASLSSRGHRLTSGGAAELLPHLWEEYREGLCEWLRGQFALALWDAAEERLLLARDRFGICPLHWTRQGGRLLFASEIKGLLASGVVEKRVDPRGISQVFTCFGLPGPVTCFGGVSALLPGHFLHACRKNGELEIRDVTYWEMDFPEQGQEVDSVNIRSHAASVESAAEGEERLLSEFEEVLLRSVERRLRADVPVLSYSSGGLDSSLLVAMARKVHGQPLSTMTFQVQHHGRDETLEADIVARHFGNESIRVPIAAEALLGAYPRLVQAAESPVIDTSAAALLLLAEQAHEHGFKVVITGEGSDEWMAGYPWFRIDKKVEWANLIPGLRLSRPGFRLFEWALGIPRMPRAQEQRLYDAVGGHNAWMYAYFLMSSSKQRFFSDSLRESLGDDVALAGLNLNLARMQRWHPLNRSLYIGARIHLAGLHLNARGDRSTMHSAVQARYPFLDEEVYAFLARLHPRWKMRGYQDKFILRRLADRWLPPELTAGRKRLIHAPLYAFHHARQPAWMDQLLSPESLAKTGYFKPDAVAHWRRSVHGMRHNYARLFIEMGLAGVVSTQLWHHTYFDSSLCDLPSWQPPPVAASV